VKRLAGIAMLAWTLLITGAPALAHAVLVTSDPAAGARLDRAPRAVTLTFDESVETQLGSLRVLDASGTQRSVGAVAHPDGDGRRVRVQLAALDRGRYVVAWQVVSADSHLVDGAFAFGVGVAAGEAPVLPADNGAKLLLPILHFFLLAGVLLGIGIPIGVFAIARRTRAAPLAIEFTAWCIVAFTAFADVAFRADLAGGSLGNAFGTHVGELRSITIGAAIAAVLALIGKRRRWPVLAMASLAAVLSLSLAGHAGEGDVAIAGIAADVLHLLGAATWIGVLAIGSTLDADPELRGITPVATTAVIALILTGIVQTARNVGSLDALLGTTYGHAIDTKIALLVVLLALAFGARRALARGTVAIAGRIKLELWLLTGVIAVTAVLVELPLPREAAAMTASPTTAFSVRDISIHATATAGDGNAWTIHVAASAPIDAADVSVRETKRNVGPLAVPMTRTDAANYTGTVTLPFAGEWSAEISARSGAFDEAHRTLPLPETAP
jgi:copper transport protein